MASARIKPQQLVLMCGPAFAGKTTLAQELARCGFERLSPDDILRSDGLEPGEGLSDECWGQAVSRVCVGLEELSRTGASVVIDDTSCYRWLRDRYRQAALACGLHVLLAVLRIERSEVLRRVEVNVRTGARQSIIDRVLHEHLDRFEWPGPDEDPHPIDALWPLERQREEILRRL